MLMVMDFEMESTIKLPTLNTRNSTLAELVIVLLTHEWPLTTKGIYNRVNRNFANGVSFQAVHKAVKKLREQEILSKKDSYYKINVKWLEQINKFSNQVEKLYEKNETRLFDIP